MNNNRVSYERFVFLIIPLILIVYGCTQKSNPTNIDIANCAGIEDDALQTMCLFGAAKKNMDDSFCSRISDEIGITSPVTRGYKPIKDFCYLNLAYLSNNTKFCLNITTQILGDYCISATKNVLGMDIMLIRSIDSNMIYQIMKDKNNMCTDVKDEVGKPICFFIEAMKKKDISMCNKIDENLIGANLGKRIIYFDDSSPWEIDYHEYDDVCYFEVAQLTSNPNYCTDIIGGDSLRDYCFAKLDSCNQTS